MTPLPVSIAAAVASFLLLRGGLRADSLTASARTLRRCCGC